MNIYNKLLMIYVIIPGLISCRTRQFNKSDTRENKSDDSQTQSPDYGYIALCSQTKRDDKNLAGALPKLRAGELNDSAVRAVDWQSCDEGSDSVSIVSLHKIDSRGNPIFPKKFPKTRSGRRIFLSHKPTVPIDTIYFMYRKSIDCKYFSDKTKSKLTCASHFGDDSGDKSLSLSKHPDSSEENAESKITVTARESNNNITIRAFKSADDDGHGGFNSSVDVNKHTGEGTVYSKPEANDVGERAINLGPIEPEDDDPLGNGTTTPPSKPRGATGESVGTIVRSGADDEANKQDFFDF